VEGPRAVTIDPSLGISHAVLFLGPAGRKLFCGLHLPPDPPRASVVLCSSINADFERTYRREVVAARSLASRGVAVARFHYRGTGNSDGHHTELTFDGMVDDAMSVLGWLRQEAGIAVPVVLGARWGALVAAATSRLSGFGPLALWEPVVEGTRYFREADRARAVRVLKEGASGQRSAEALDVELARYEEADVLGYPITRAFYDSAVERTLAREAGELSRAVLFVEIGSRGGLRPENARQVRRWEEMGFHVRTAQVEGRETWWFIGDRWEPEERRPLTLELARVTGDWILEHIRSGGWGG